MCLAFERNVTNRETERWSNYDDLEIEVTKMGNMRATIVPVIVWSPGPYQKANE